MKIKLAILEKDKTYLSRIVSVFSTKYADKFEVYTFTDMKTALETVDSAKIDVLVSNDAFEFDVQNLPGRCAFAYLVDSHDIDMFNGHRTICKFQKVDLIYKQILSIYSENAGNITGLKFSGEGGKILVFSSPCGGVGTTTMAASCASYFAAKSKKTLYLNLERFGSSNVFFEADGQFDMSDIIFALKSKKANLPMKMESCIRQDAGGVYYYSHSKVALDMIELGSEEISKLITELKITGSYDYIIVDYDFGLSSDDIKVFKQANSIVWVCDGTEIANLKMRRAYTALSILEKNAESPLTRRLNIVYNKFSNKTGKALEVIDAKNIGGAPKYEHATPKQIMKQISLNSMFENIE